VGFISISNKILKVFVLISFLQDSFYPDVEFWMKKCRKNIYLTDIKGFIKAQLGSRRRPFISYNIKGEICVNTCNIKDTIFCSNPNSIYPSVMIWIAFIDFYRFHFFTNRNTRCQQY